MPFTPEQEARMRQIFRDEITASRIASVLKLADNLDGFVLSDKYVFDKLIQIRDGRGIQAGRATGLKIGTGTDQKLGFFNASPVVQPVRPTDAASIITTGTSLGIWA